MKIKKVFKLANGPDRSIITRTSNYSSFFASTVNIPKTYTVQSAFYMRTMPSSRQALSFQEKDSLRLYKSQNPSVTQQVCQKWFLQTFGKKITQSTISEILASTKPRRVRNPTRQRESSFKYPELDPALYKRALEVQKSGKVLTYPLLQQLAYQVWPTVYQTDPQTLSVGMMQRFATRNNLVVSSSKGLGSRNNTIAPSIPSSSTSKVVTSSSSSSSGIDFTPQTHCSDSPTGPGLSQVTSSPSTQSRKRDRDQYTSDGSAGIQLSMDLLDFQSELSFPNYTGDSPPAFRMKYSDLPSSNPSAPLPSAITDMFACSPPYSPPSLVMTSRDSVSSEYRSISSPSMLPTAISNDYLYGVHPVDVPEPNFLMSFEPTWSMPDHPHQTQPPQLYNHCRKQELPNEVHSLQSTHELHSVQSTDFSAGVEDGSFSKTEDMVNYYYAMLQLEEEEYLNPLDYLSNTRPQTC